MALYNAAPGLNFASEYQVAGTPFVHSAGANFTIDLDYVTSAVTVVCTTQHAGNTIDFGDTGGTAMNLALGMQRFEVKCKQINVVNGSGTISVCAELTGIAAKELSPHDQADFGAIS